MAKPAKRYRTFVTVGTHEQPFNRLVKAVDELAENGGIPVPVFVQTGYCTYVPEHCDYSKMLAPTDIGELMDRADVVVTHGGPSSFMEAIGRNKIPVVAPRMARFGEHVNDHQVEFAHAVEARFGNIIVVEEDDRLAEAVHRALVSGPSLLASNNEQFCRKFANLVFEMGLS